MTRNSYCNRNANKRGNLITHHLVHSLYNCNCLAYHIDRHSCQLLHTIIDCSHKPVVLFCQIMFVVVLSHKTYTIPMESKARHLMQTVILLSMLIAVCSAITVLHVRYTPLIKFYFNMNTQFRYRRHWIICFTWCKQNKVHKATTAMNRSNKYKIIMMMVFKSSTQTKWALIIIKS